MVPSTYEAGKLYNVLPSGNRAPDSTGENSGYDQTRADFDFDRGSNTAATRVNADGLIEKYRENVLTYSNQPNQWSVDNVSLTSGQEGYDGTNNAWLFNSSAGYIRNNLSLSGVYTYSIYAKQGTADGIRLRMDAGTDANVYISLTDGSESFSPSGIDYTATNVGDGWWRISVTQNDSSFSNFRVYAIDSSGNSTTGTIYIQNAQVERSLVPTGYLETATTTTGKAGVLIDLPRIDYSSGAGALLLEPSRQNLVVFSEYLNGGIWIQSASSVTDNDATSPEGLTNAAKVEGDGTNNQIRLYDNYTFPSTGDYVLSVFAKAGNNDFIALAYKGVDGGITAYFDLSEGTTSDTANGTIEAVGNDGWYRCSLKANLAGPDLTGNYNMYVARDLTTTTFPSNGDANGQYVHAYGFQVEAGSYSTSYIPNHGESGGVTRAADLCYKMGASDVIGQTEGTLFYDWVMNHESPNTSEDLYTLTMSDGTGNKMIGVNNYNNTLVVFIKDTTTQFYDNSYTSGADGARIKLAIGYANNDIALYINGAQIATDSSATIPTLSQVRLNTFWNGNLADFSSVKQLALFNERLTNEELATLTTL